MKRKDAIAHIKVAGYHGDTKTAMRIYTEHRISFKTYTEAFARGRELKAEGMPCTCTDCAKAAAMIPASPMPPASLLMELAEFGEVRKGYLCLREAGGRYVMEDTRNVFNRHSLAVEATCETRLEAHWAGFIENNQ